MALDFEAMLNQVQPKRKTTQRAASPKEAAPQGVTPSPKGASSLPPLSLRYPEGQAPAPAPTPAPAPQPVVRTTPLPAPDSERVAFVPTAKAGRSPKGGPSSRPSKTVAIKGRDIHILRYLTEARYATPAHIHAALAAVCPEVFNPATGKVDNSLGSIEKRLSILRKHGFVEGIPGTIFSTTSLVRITNKGMSAAQSHHLAPTKVGPPGSGSESLAHILLVSAEVAKVRGGWYSGLGLPHDANIVLESRLAQATGHAREQTLWTPRYVPSNGKPYDPSVLDVADYAVYREGGEFGTPDLVIIGEDRAVSIEVECRRKDSATLLKNLRAYSETGREVWYIVGTTDSLGDPDRDTMTALSTATAKLQAQGLDTSNILLVEADMSLATPYWDQREYDDWRARIRLHTGQG